MTAQLRNKNGFTLLELLLAIAIASILATISITTFPGILQRSRDSRRKADLKIISSALEQYYSNNNAYPDSTNLAVTFKSTSVNPWISDLTPQYITSIPVDPKNSATSYYYYSAPAGHQSYTIWADLERNDDQDRANSPTASCTVAYPIGEIFDNYDFCAQSP